MSAELCERSMSANLFKCNTNTVKSSCTSRRCSAVPLYQLLRSRLLSQVGLDAMRCAESLLPDDPEVIEISLYRKYNRCMNGPLNERDVAPNPTLHDFPAANNVYLHDVLTQSSKQRVVMFAGSYS